MHSTYAQVGPDLGKTSDLEHSLWRSPDAEVLRQCTDEQLIEGKRPAVHQYECLYRNQNQTNAIVKTSAEELGGAPDVSDLIIPDFVLALYYALRLTRRH